MDHIEKKLLNIKGTSKAESLSTASLGQRQLNGEA